LPEGIRHVRGALRNLVSCADEFRRLVHDVVLDMIPMREREARDVMRVFEGIAWRVAAVSSGDVCTGLTTGSRAETLAHRPGPARQGRAAAREVLLVQGEGDEEYEKILVAKTIMRNSGLPVRYSGYPPSTVLTTTSTGAFPTLNSWTTGDPRSCWKKAWPPSAGRTGTSRMSPPP